MLSCHVSCIKWPFHADLEKYAHTTIINNGCAKSMNKVAKRTILQTPSHSQMRDGFQPLAPLPPFRETQNWTATRQKYSYIVSVPMPRICAYLVAYTTYIDERRFVWYMPQDTKQISVALGTNITSVALRYMTPRYLHATLHTPYEPPCIGDTCKTQLRTPLGVEQIQNELYLTELHVSSVQTWNMEHVGTCRWSTGSQSFRRHKIRGPKNQTSEET